MNVQALISLAVVVAYIPLFVILVSNRPWQRQHKLFILVLVPTVLWGLGNFLFRSDLFMQDRLLLFKLVMCFFAWAAVQFHYFLTSFYQPKGFGFPLAYVLLAAIIVVTLLGYLAEGVAFINDIPVPVYGIAFIPVALSLCVLFGRDFYLLWRRFTVLTDPVRRNQILYLLFGIVLMTLFSLSAVTDVGKQYPLTHLGAVFNAGILTYAVLRHRLLDMRIAFRRGLGWVGLGAIGIAVYLLLFYSIRLLFDFEGHTATLVSSTAAALALVVVIYLLRGLVIQGADRLFHQERYDYRQRLHSFVQREMGGISSLEEFSQKMLPLLTKSLDCQQAYLLLPEGVNGDFVVDFSEPQKENVLQVILRQDNPVLEWLRRENRYLLKESLGIIPEFRGMWAEESDGLKALDVELLFPLVSRGSLIAILALGKKESGRYPLEDVNLVETVAAQVATSLEKEYLQEQLRNREQELSLINRLAGVITSSLNIREVYSVFIAELKDVIDVDWATIALIEGDKLHFEVLSTEVGSAWQAGEKIPLEGTGTEWVAKRKKVLVEPDLAKNKRFWTGENHLKYGIRAIVYLPLVVKGEAIGSLIVASRQPNAYTPGQVHLLERLASQIAVPVENSRLYAKAEQRARVDELTGLFNRRHFDERLGEEIDRHSRHGGMLSLIFLDLDFFKAYNDKRGHMAGDKVLAQIGQLIEKAIRNIDIAFRYGGDEFAVLLPQSEADDAFVVAERVRGKIAAEMRKKKFRITASLGLASWPSDGVAPDELINAADRALYYTKQTGGNRTCVASKMLPSLTETPAPGATSEKEALSIIYALAATIEARDPFTYGHSRKVSSYAVALAEAIGLPSEKVAVISTAALLHDIGKIGIPDEVLKKVGKLEAETWELIQSHAKLSATIVGHVISLVSCLPAILHHHERWDGTGYPSGLKGEAIPIEARILAIADAFDAMTSSRPYREPLSYKKVLDELKRCSGTQFDPKLVEAFLPIALSTAPEEIGAVEDSGSSKSDS
ncbi:MAG: diguanylate cyclase [Chloroflexi bacterium]|nr:diguanylate cyclase [Chloroflexota bacterium]